MLVICNPPVRTSPKVMPFNVKSGFDVVFCFLSSVFWCGTHLFLFVFRRIQGVSSILFCIFQDPGSIITIASLCFPFDSKLDLCLLSWRDLLSFFQSCGVNWVTDCFKFIDRKEKNVPRNANNHNMDNVNSFYDGCLRKKQGENNFKCQVTATWKLT